MKQIEEVPIWYNGELKEAKWLNIYVSNIILGASSQINYELYEKQVVNGIDVYGVTRLASGQLLLDGQDYSNWGSDDDYVWIWAADKLNLTLVPNI